MKVNLLGKDASDKEILNSFRKVDDYYWRIVGNKIMFLDKNGNKVDIVEYVKGYFDCSYTNITSLEGAPQEVSEGFYCSHTNITSLKGAPQKVGEDFYCSHTNITSLKGAPQKVGGSFDCCKTKITSLEGAPQKVGGNFYCSYNNNLNSLEGSPMKVGRGFYCSNINIPQKEIDAYVEFLNHPTPEHIDETGHYKP